MLRDLGLAGHPINSSLSIYSVTCKRPELSTIVYIIGVVTCLHLDPNGEQLITGSADTTCKIWTVSRTSGVMDQPTQCLYGHDDEVTCVVISSEYDMAVSGSKVRSTHNGSDELIIQ